MKQLRKKSAAVSKRAKRVKRVKKRTPYAAQPKKSPAEKPATPFDLLRAAHRSRMGAAVAASAADHLRSVSQVMGMALDTSKRRGELPPAVATAINTAELMLADQIGALDRLAGELPLGPIDVGDVVVRTVALMKSERDAGIKITVDIADAMAPARGNALDLAEIVFELVQNSCDALATSGERIHVSTAQTVDAVRVVVQDDGPGLPAAMRRGLFEPHAPRTSNHLGIGLAVAHALAQRNLGTLVYEPRGGRGARFVLTFPRWKSGRPASTR